MPDQKAQQTSPPAVEAVGKLAIVGAVCGVVAAIATALACVAAFAEVGELQKQAAESQNLAQKGFDLASKVQSDQVRADERKYAERVFVRTDHVGQGDTVRVRVTIKNFDPTASITDVRLETPGSSGDPASIVRLNSVTECTMATFSIAGNWWKRSSSFVVFRDADGRYWKRVESEPVESSAAVADQEVYRKAVSGNRQATRSDGYDRLKPDTGEKKSLSTC